MSEHYEAIIIKTNYTVAQTLINGLNLKGHRVEVVPLGMNISSICQSSHRQVLQESIIYHIAKLLSTIINEALVVFYDNQIGKNNATFYQDGEAVARFANKDAVWVRLDEQGQPIIEGPFYTTIEIERDTINEYEYIRSPIDISLENFGISPPITAKELKQALCYSTQSKYLEIESKSR